MLIAGQELNAYFLKFLSSFFLTKFGPKKLKFSK